MSLGAFTEPDVENAALACLEELGYAALHGSDIAAGERAAERSDPNDREAALERRGRTRHLLRSGALMTVDPAINRAAMAR